MSQSASLFKRALFTALVMVLAAAAGSAGVVLWRTLNPPPSQVALSPTLATAQALGGQLQVGERRPEFSLPDTDGRLRHIAEFDGKLLFINFWATWCPPCLEEIPAFVRLQHEYGARDVQFLGIALDTRDNARRFLDEQAVNYPSLHGERDAIELGKRYGNSVGALPYTVVVARDGTVLMTKHGLLHEDEARALIDANL